MARVYQVPHHAFGWLVAGTFMAALPHLIHGPLWLRILLPATVLGRILIQRGRLPMPGRVLRVSLLGGVLLGTLYTHGTVLGPDAGTCLLVAAFALKLLEMVRLRDAYVLLVLGYFVLATTFLFYQGPIASLYVLLSMLCLTAALPGINHPEAGARAWRHFRLALVMLLQAVPLMLLLFVLVPRISPLWSLEFSQERSRTGMSDSMAPGEVSHLSQSRELAFRVEFEGAVPPPAERYWRGLTYAWFDGRRWSQARPQEISQEDYVWFPASPQPRPDWVATLMAARGEAAARGPVYRYRVVQEPSRRNWLYALAVPFADDTRLGLVRDLRLVSREELNQRRDYRVTSYPALRSSMPMSPADEAISLQLPEGFNPRAREMARRWYREAGSAEAYANRLLRWFREESFYYTLEPPLLGEHTVDEFLFGSRRGFCEHYASAFAFMMRAAGVPARIVAGYQGGELNPVGNHLRVHQYHAHAWTEIWLPGSGWVEVDPTAAVAPSRIEMGPEAALQDDPLADFQGIMRDLPWLQQLSNRFDYVQFIWQKWVLDYDESSQLSLLQRWLGDVSPARIGMALAAGAAVLLLPVALWVLLRRRGPGRTPMQREYRAMLKQLRGRGLVLSDDLPPRRLVREAGGQWPAARPVLKKWGRAFEESVYGGQAGTSLRALRRYRRQLRWLRGARGGQHVSPG
jgi:protein-glutamine gamma-glutamyltransferase